MVKHRRRIVAAAVLPVAVGGGAVPVTLFITDAAAGSQAKPSVLSSQSGSSTTGTTPSPSLLHPAGASTSSEQAGPAENTALIGVTDDGTILTSAAYRIGTPTADAPGPDAASLVSTTLSHRYQAAGTPVVYVTTVDSPRTASNDADVLLVDPADTAPVSEEVARLSPEKVTVLASEDELSNDQAAATASSATVLLVPDDGTVPEAVLEAVDSLAPSSVVAADAGTPVPDAALATIQDHAAAATAGLESESVVYSTQEADELAEFDEAAGHIVLSDAEVEGVPHEPIVTPAEGVDLVDHDAVPVSEAGTDEQEEPQPDEDSATTAPEPEVPGEPGAPSPSPEPEPEPTAAPTPAGPQPVIREASRTFQVNPTYSSTLDSEHWKGDASLTLDLRATVGACSSWLWDAKGLRVNRARLTVGPFVSTDVSIEATGALEGEQTFPFATYSLQISFYIGPIPIVINSDTTVTATVTADASAKITASAGADAAIEAGFDYSNGQFDLVGEPTSTVRNPVIAGGGEFTGSVDISASEKVSFYNMIGVSARLGSGLDTHIKAVAGAGGPGATLENPGTFSGTCTINLSVNGGVGVFGQLVILGIRILPAWEKEWAFDEVVYTSPALCAQVSTDPLPSAAPAPVETPTATVPAPETGSTPETDEAEELVPAA